MTEKEKTLMIARAMGKQVVPYSSAEHGHNSWICDGDPVYMFMTEWFKYDPLHDAAQALEVAVHFQIVIDPRVNTRTVDDVLLHIFDKASELAEWWCENCKPKEEVKV